jgi:integrase
MAWAEEQGLVDRSPIAHFKKPKAGVRQTIITPEEYAVILNLLPNERFRDLLIFAWETGARAAECLATEKRHVELPSHRIVFPVDEEKMQRAPRIIYLTDTAEEIVRRLVIQHPSGPIFCNTNGAAWTTEAVNCAFVGLQIRTGLRAMKQEGIAPSEEEIERKIATLKKDRKAKRRVVQKTADELREEARRKLRNAAACSRAKKLCLTVFRHSFCHRLLKSGVDALTVSVLMGHADPSMIAKVYSHLSQAPQYLRDALRKAAG